MATPIGDAGDIDESTLERFTRTLVDADVHGLFPGSSIGEFPSLTLEQNRTVVETVVAASGDTPVLAGCCDTSLPDVVERIEHAADAGADAAVVVTPYYLDTTQAGLERFFTRVADASQLPVLLYNIPALTGNPIGVDTVASLADHPNVVGLKDTSGNMTYLHRVVSRTPDDFDVLQGATELAAAALDIGADGLVAGPANVFPGVMAELYEAHEAGDQAGVARIIHRLVAPLVSATSDVPTASAVKHLLARSGIDVGDPLPPLPLLTDDERAALDRTYREVVDGFDAATVEN